MAEKARFYLVWDADDVRSVGLAEREDEAIVKARAWAEDNLGHTVIVFEPKEAFRSVPRTEKVYLSWPASDAVACEPPPPPSPTPPIESAEARRAAMFLGIDPDDPDGVPCD
jgi:hypothetical protein